MRYVSFTLVCLLSAFTPVSQAADEPSWSIGAGIGPNLTNADVVGDELKSSVGAAAWGSREWGEMNRFDISFDYFKFSGSGQSYPSINLAYGLRFFPDTRLKPFALLGLGIGQANRFPQTTDQNQICFNLFGRAGVSNILYGERWNVGLMFDFEHVNMDGDRITSAQLALPMLTFVWRLDNEPETVKTTEVAAKPRVDSDKDGVFDDKDHCPNSPRGVRVNSIGCQPKQKVVKTLKVEFDTAKATIRQSFMSELDEFGKFLQDNPDLNVTIEGHTDTVGSRTYNIRLSGDRAQSVRAALIERFQLDPKRLKSIGYGPDKPVADNSTPDGRQLNRRVNAILESE